MVWDPSQFSIVVWQQKVWHAYCSICHCPPHNDEQLNFKDASKRGVIWFWFCFQTHSRNPCTQTTSHDKSVDPTFRHWGHISKEILFLQKQCQCSRCHPRRRQASLWQGPSVPQKLCIWHMVSLEFCRSCTLLGRASDTLSQNTIFHDVTHRKNKMC